ncbi:MAG TPA: ATP-binding protein [Bordetella sp.]|nr:ATP-binding protein [Bordetella sp.]
MTLQRRLIIAVLVAAPLAWMLTIAGTYWRARHEIDELYDTDMVRLAEQTLAMAALIPASASLPPATHREHLPGDTGYANRGDLSVAIWRGAGAPLVLDPQALQFPRNETGEGFFDGSVNGAPWRLYYLNEPSGNARVAVGHRLGERDELARVYIASQIVPWLIGLPVLILLMIFAVRRSLRPVRDLSAEVERHNPNDATPLSTRDTPGELKVLVRAMNGLFSRVAILLDQERRLTADAAHELRTPLAALRAQWDVAQRTEDPAERRGVQDSVTRGLERMDRLVSQLLIMARLDSDGQRDAGGAVDWKRVAEQAVGDCLWIANRRDIDIDIEWPRDGDAPLPMNGDTDALVIMLKNVLDNAIRYGPNGSRVRLAFAATRIVVDDQGQGIAAEILPRLGERFVRAAGNVESGSGLGVSIARRIARNHGLELRYSMRDAASDLGPGLSVEIVKIRETTGISRRQG